MDKITSFFNIIESFFASIPLKFYDFIRPYRPSLEFFFKNYGEYAKYGLIALICVLFFVVMYKFGAQAFFDKISTSSEDLNERLLRAMKTGKTEAFNYDRIYDVLKRKGASYYFPGLTPLNYITLKFAFAIAGLVLGFIFHPIFGVVLAFVGYFAIDIVLNIKNSADNENMIDDIMNISDVIILQTSSGTYITQTIIDSYLVAKNERLKNGLLELSGNIKATNDLSHSLAEFKSQFDNEHLNNIAVALEQANETGTSVQMLEDIKKHANTIQASFFDKEASKTKRLTMGLQIFVFVCIMLILCFGLAIGLQDSLAELGMF